jgi:membrane-bound ClpP family serine protease
MQPVDNLSQTALNIWTSMVIYALTMSISSYSTTTSILVIVFGIAMIFLLFVRRAKNVKKLSMILMSCISLASSLFFREYSEFAFGILLAFSFLMLICSFFIKAHPKNEELR